MIYRSFYLKGNNYLIFLSKVEVDMSKTEVSSKNEGSELRNEELLRDFLNV